MTRKQPRAPWLLLMLLASRRPRAGLGTSRTIDPMFRTLDAVSFTPDAVFCTHDAVFCTHDARFRAIDGAFWVVV